MSEYNLRQFQRMSESIDAYQGGAASLKKCINNLKGLIACLELPDETLKTKFQAKWGILWSTTIISAFKRQLELSYSIV